MSDAYFPFSRDHPSPRYHELVSLYRQMHERGEFCICQRCVLPCAQKKLPAGENMHCTIKPAEWWEELFKQAWAQHPGIVWEAWIQSQIDTPQGTKEIEKKLVGGGSCAGAWIAD